MMFLNQKNYVNYWESILTLEWKNFLCKVDFFPPKFPFPKYKRKIWREKKLLCKGTRSYWNASKMEFFGKFGVEIYGL
jgi:hypothetical protein